MSQHSSASTLNNYVRLDAAKAVQEEHIQDHEIRITGPGKTRNYIAYATGLLTQKGYTAVELKAMGQAINKTVTIAEIIKRRILGLHQNNQIASIAIQDTWEPIEEGLDSISVTRHVSVISITLSTLPLNERSPGYQPPLPPEMVKTHLSPGPGPQMSPPPPPGVGLVPPGASGLSTGTSPKSYHGLPLLDGYMPAGATAQQLQDQLAELKLLAAQQAQIQQQASKLPQTAGQVQTAQLEAFPMGRTVHFDGRDHHRTGSGNLGGRMMGGGS